MAEMITNRPLCPGDSEIGQLFKIFQVAGTPNETLWPGITSYPEYKSTFPKWKPQNLAEILPELDSKGIDVMNKFLTLDPDKRITIKEAIYHVRLY